MATLLTLNLTKKMLKLHKPRRRHMAAVYIKREVARLNKVDVESVKLDAVLNKSIQFGMSKHPGKIRLSIEKADNVLKVSLFKPVVAAAAAAPAKQEAKPAAAKKAEAPKKAAAPEAKKPAEAKPKA